MINVLLDWTEMMLIPGSLFTVFCLTSTPAFSCMLGSCDPQDLIGKRTGILSRQVGLKFIYKTENHVQSIV